MELERDVESYLKREVAKRGGLCIKAGQDGWPDRIVLLPGGCIAWCELKRSDGELSPLQRHRGKVLRSLGQRVYIVYTKEEADDMLNEIRRK